MAEGPPSSLNDFFKKDKKKKIKGSNLNNSMNDKPEEKKEQKKKTEEDDGWHEEEVVQATMKVEVAGKLVREEEKEKEEEAVAPAWGVIKNKGTSDPKDDKRYPSLAKSVASSAIHLEDKSGQVNIATSKNIFATLENDDDDEDGPKRPKDIKPALVSKKKGEREKDAIQREVSKYKDPKKDDKEDDHDAEEDAEKEVKPKKKDEKNEKKSEKFCPEGELQGSRAKFWGFANPTRPCGCEKQVHWQKEVAKETTSSRGAWRGKGEQTSEASREEELGANWWRRGGDWIRWQVWGRLDAEAPRHLEKLQHPEPTKSWPSWADSWVFFSGSSSSRIVKTLEIFERLSSQCKTVYQ